MEYKPCPECNAELRTDAIGCDCGWREGDSSASPCSRFAELAESVGILYTMNHDPRTCGPSITLQFRDMKTLNRWVREFEKERKEVLEAPAMEWKSLTVRNPKTGGKVTWDE